MCRHAHVLIHCYCHYRCGAFRIIVSVSYKLHNDIGCRRVEIWNAFIMRSKGRVYVCASANVSNVAVLMRRSFGAQRQVDFTANSNLFSDSVIVPLDQASGYVGSRKRLNYNVSCVLDKERIITLYTYFSTARPYYIYYMLANVVEHEGIFSFEARRRTKKKKIINYLFVCGNRRRRPSDIASRHETII